MDATTAHLLTLLGSAVERLTEEIRGIREQQDAILKAVTRPRLTIRRTWEEYLKPISGMLKMAGSILSWLPTVWLAQLLLRGGDLHDVLAKLSGLF